MIPKGLAAVTCDPVLYFMWLEQMTPSICVCSPTPTHSCLWVVSIFTPSSWPFQPSHQPFKYNIIINLICHRSLGSLLEEDWGGGERFEFSERILKGSLLFQEHQLGRKASSYNIKIMKGSFGCIHLLVIMVIVLLSPAASSRHLSRRPVSGIYIYIYIYII